MAVGTLLSGAPRAHRGARPRVRPAHRRQRRSRVGTVLGAAAAVGLLASLIGNELQANARFDTAHRSLLATRYGIDLVEASLAGARGELAAVDGQVGAATVALQQDSAELQAARSALTDAQAHVWQQTSTIGALNTCLGGVEQALNALSVDDQGHAIAALQAVASSCGQVTASRG